MARPKSDDRRAALLEAATRVIAAQGLGAPTAAIAASAGVSNGSLFTYFATKTELFNQLYVELKREMATAVMEGLVSQSPAKQQFERLWTNWTRWALANAEKRRVLALLQVSSELSDATRARVREGMAPAEQLLERVRAQGPMKAAPSALVGALLTSVAETTIDLMLREPKEARAYARAGFDALWRMLA